MKIESILNAQEITELAKEDSKKKEQPITWKDGFLQKRS